MVRGATLIHGQTITVRLRDTPLACASISPTSDVCLTLRNTLLPHFLRTLRGPFDDLSLTRLSAARALCEVLVAVISASLV